MKRHPVEGTEDIELPNEMDHTTLSQRFPFERENHMTAYRPGDESRTQELVTQLDSDQSWLRHKGFAAELDRRLLQGASATDLEEVRASWRGHILHLRRVHRIQVEETAAGFLRIVGSEPAALPAVSGAGSVEDYEDLAEPEDGRDTKIVIPEIESRLRISARALSALAGQNLLANPLIKDSVGMLTRQASESNHWHLCAHFRSTSAANRIAQAPIATGSQYQAFCRVNLRHEHVVPNNVIYKMLKCATDTSVAAIEAILIDFCVRATITVEEDAVLNKAGLASTMPHGFDVEGDPLYNNPLARYIHTGLIESLQRRGNDLWYPG